MKLDILELEEEYARFSIEDVHPYFVNALRRTLLAEVPKLAIHKVTFYDNTSALFDENIAHRLGLVPIPTDPSTLNMIGQVDDEGNPTYVVRYTLTKEGPGTVYSGDLECEDKFFAIKDDRIPIVELLEGQRLILECEAILGQGTEHAKWQVCHAVGYKYKADATIDNRKFDQEAAEKALARTPKGVLAMDGSKLVVADPENAEMADGAQQWLGDGLTVEYDDRKFIFRFETDGSLKAEDAMMKAVEILKERFQAFQEAVDSL